MGTRVTLEIGDKNVENLENGWNRVPDSCRNRHRSRGLGTGGAGGNGDSVCDSVLGSPFWLRNKFINSWLWRFVR